MITPVKYSNPKLHDKEVQTLQELIEALNWVDATFPIVRQGFSETGTYPEVYKNDGTKENIKVYPDTDTGCFCFFEMQGDAICIDPEDTAYRYPLSVTFWMQLDKVNGAKAYDYTSEKIVLITNLLKNAGCEDISYTTDPDDIFEKYSDLKPERLNFAQRTFSAFKINFSIIGVQCN